MSSLRHHRKVKSIRARKAAKWETNRIKKLLKTKRKMADSHASAGQVS